MCREQCYIRPMTICTGKNIIYMRFYRNISDLDIKNSLLYNVKNIK
jgi:hypothetical protein